MPIQQWIDGQMIPTAPRKSASESMEVFNQAGRLPQEIAKDTSNARQHVKAAVETTNETTEKVVKGMAEGAEKIAKRANNKWLIGVAAVGTVLAGIFGYKALNKPKEELQETAQIQEAA